MKDYKCKLLALGLAFSGLAFAESEGRLIDEQLNPWWHSYNLESAGQYQAAATSLEPLLKSADDEEFVEMRIAWLYYLAQDYNRSVTHYERAIKINKNALESRLGLMLPLMAQQRWREASLQANEVLAQSKWNYYAHLRLMVCEEALGLWDQLALHAVEVHQRYPADVAVLVYAARAYSQKNLLDTAQAYYAQVLKRMPWHTEANDFMKRS